MARWPQARSAAVHRVFTRDGVEGFWAIMLPLPPGVQPRADIPRQMENLVDQVQPGLWQTGSLAEGQVCWRLLPLSAATCWTDPSIRLTFGLLGSQLVAAAKIV